MSLYLRSKELLAVYVTGDTSKPGQFASKGTLHQAPSWLASLPLFLSARSSQPWPETGWDAGALLYCCRRSAHRTWSASAFECPYHLVILVALATGTLIQVCSEEPCVTFVTGTLENWGAPLLRVISAAHCRFCCAGCLADSAFNGAVGENFFLT